MIVPSGLRGWSVKLVLRCLEAAVYSSAYTNIYVQIYRMIYLFFLQRA